MRDYFPEQWHQVQPAEAEEAMRPRVENELPGVPEDVGLVDETQRGVESGSDPRESHEVVHPVIRKIHIHTPPGPRRGSRAVARRGQEPAEHQVLSLDDEGELDIGAFGHSVAEPGTRL